jgi:hypothetical protein
MKKVFLYVVSTVLLFFVVSSLSLQAQNIFSKRDMVANAGMGFGGTNAFGFLMSGSFDYGIIDHLFDEKSSLGIGGFLGYSVHDHKFTYISTTQFNNGWKEKNLILGARGALHYQFVDKLDTYGGLMLGYNIVSPKYYGDWSEVIRTNPNSTVVSSIFVGGRYYITNHIGAFSELGFGYGLYYYLQIGVSFRF